MVVDKNTYHMKSFALELEDDVTTQGEESEDGHEGGRDLRREPRGNPQRSL